MTVSNDSVKLIHDLMLALTFLCEKHIQFYHLSLLQGFQLFPFLFFQVKMVNHCEGYVKFLLIKYQLHYHFL